MAIITPITMATDNRGMVTYAVFPPDADADLVWGFELVASAAQSITLPLTPISNVPWQVFIRYKNAAMSSMVWVAETAPDVTPVTPDLPTTTVANMNSVLEPPAWVLVGGSSLSFISANTGDIVSVMAYLGVYGNI